FMKYAWPGNVRELQNIIERMMNFSHNGELTVDLIPEDILRVQPSLSNVGEEFEAAKDLERQMIEKMVRMKISRNEIMKKLKISRSTLYRKMERYNLVNHPAAKTAARSSS
ncbi:MAG: helix-turn-helix domain-containing protein, partial [Smithella sp.]